jgi:hypothetical protein
LTPTYIGVRNTVYKGGYYQLDEPFEDVTGTTMAYIPPQQVTAQDPGCWTGFGYHWAWIGTTVGCSTMISWHIGDELRSIETSGLSLSHADNFDTEAAGISKWDRVGFHNLAGIQDLLGMKSGSELGHYLYVTGAHVFDLRYGDRQPAVYIAPNRKDAAVIMFHSKEDTAVLIRVSVDKEGNWEVTDQVTYQYLPQ